MHQMKWESGYFILPAHSKTRAEGDIDGGGVRSVDGGIFGRGKTVISVSGQGQRLRLNAGGGGTIEGAGGARQGGHHKGV